MNSSQISHVTQNLLCGMWFQSRNLSWIPVKLVTWHKTYSAECDDVDIDVEAMVLSSNEEHLKASSRASIQQRPAALLGALKMQCEVGRGWTTAPMASPSGPREAQTLWSMGWKSLKQKPSFFEGRSISSLVDKIIVPIHCELWKINQYV